jgi:hypothetical protein
MPILATLFFMQGIYRAFKHSRPAKVVTYHKINEV